MSVDGSVKACGKGSYGRLGLGDSNNQSMPKKLVLEPHRNIKKVSSSKGSDGHTLAITVEGEVRSQNKYCHIFNSFYSESIENIVNAVTSSEDTYAVVFDSFSSLFFYNEW